VLLIMGAVTLIALILPGQGRLTDLWRDSIAPWFGSGRWLLPFVLLAAGWYVERSRRNSAAWTARLFGGGLMFVSVLGLIELVGGSLELSGGRIGGFLEGILSGLITSPGAFVLLAGGAVVGLLIMLDTPLRQLIAPFSGWAQTVSAALTAPERADDADRSAAARGVPPGATKATALDDPAPTRGARRGGDASVDVSAVAPSNRIPAAIPSTAPMSSTFAATPSVLDALPADTGTGGPFAAGAAWAADLTTDEKNGKSRPLTPVGPGTPAGVPAARGANGTLGPSTDVAGDVDVLAPPIPRPDYRWVVPPLTVLDDIAAKKGGASMDHDRNAAIITAKLASFNIPVRVETWNAGPVVTQYEVEPSPEVKVSRIEGLSDDLAMALAARTLRIEAPIPGKSVVGIEIPNSDFNVVALRRVAEEADFRATPSKLTFALGRDVAGHARSVDLAKMPHLLIAGATGSGKSVMVNAVIASLLLSATPDEVHLILMDLKRVELAAYNGTPHLKVPVITEPGQAKAALKWAVAEMEYRYRRLAGATARNIAAFNETRVDPSDKMPYIVIVIDELADLMMREGKNVEDPIVRLAQKARATGIHMVLATQRPSVNVVTGLIKANFPSRIAFAMASQIDSRTILDAPGAEDLIGRGDMLYQPADLPRPVRLQGVFVSDREIHGIVDHWKREAENAGGLRYDLSIVQNDEDSVGSVEEQPDEEADRLLMDAVGVIQEYDRASASLLQRRLKVGYARAARIIDQLEARGYIGPFDGSNARQVLRRDPAPAAAGAVWEADGPDDEG
jgi:hypothetical protein